MTGNRKRSRDEQQARARLDDWIISVKEMRVHLQEWVRDKPRHHVDETDLPFMSDDHSPLLSSLDELLHGIDRLPTSKARTAHLRTFFAVLSSTLDLGYAIGTKSPDTARRIRAGNAATARQAPGSPGGKRLSQRQAKQRREQIIDEIAPPGLIERPFATAGTILGRVNAKLSAQRAKPTTVPAIGKYLKKRVSA